MKKSNKIFLLHILESIHRIEKFTKNLSEKKFLKSEEKQDASIRRLEIIGEAVKNLPKSFRDKYPEIEWSKISGMRNIIVHEYFGVDLKLTYKIIKKKMPELKSSILKILKKLN
jgi:uncharacterized protein with HEPN domain